MVDSILVSVDFSNKNDTGVMVVGRKRMNQSSDNLNDNLNVSNEFSIVADPFAYANFHSMRFIEYMGAKWKISNVEVQYPRLILTVGGVYNEQTTETA